MPWRRNGVVVRVMERLGHIFGRDFEVSVCVANKTRKLLQVQYLVVVLEYSTRYLVLVSGEGRNFFKMLVQYLYGTCTVLEHYR